MTKKEKVIEMIRVAFDVWEEEYRRDDDWSEEHEARDMAIKALEEPSVNETLDKIRAEIEQEIIPRNSDQYDHEIMWQNCGLRMALKAIDKHKAESEE